MESKKINQLATELTPSLSDLTIIGDPSTGISKKITLSQMASLFTGTVEEYASLAAFPLVGVADTIYIALDTNVLYRWDTGLTSYVELSPNIINSLVFNDANGFDGTISLVGSVATLTITTALTQGSVPFIGTSGALTQDNANLFFDDTNNRLGINTSSPTTALDVFGSGIIGRVNGTSTNNAFLGFASAGSNKWSVGNVQSDHRFRIYNEATTSELVSVLQTGEFGIGIANPTTKLHIDGGASALIANLDANVSVAKSVSFRSDNSNRFNIEVSGTESGSNAGANFFIRRYSDAGSLIDTPLTITRSTGAATFSNSITANAASQINGLTQDAIQNIFTIQGYNAAAESKALYFQLTAGTPLYTIRTGSTGIDAGINIMPNGTSGLSLAYNGTAIFSSSVTAAQLLATSSGNAALITSTGTTAFGLVATGSAGGARDIFLAGQSGFSNGFTVQFTGTEMKYAFQSGNVGIGTNNPADLLTLSKSTYPQIRLIETTANTSSIFGYDSPSSEWRIRTLTSIPLTFGTNDIERMRITDNGTVIIGGAVPVTHASTNFIIEDNTITNSRALIFYSANTQNARAFIKHNTTTTSQNLTFDSSYGSGVGTASFHFLGGNLAIGNTAPAASLHNRGSFITESSYYYGESKAISFQSSFTNPTVSLITINNQATYGLTMIRVTVYQNGVANSIPCNIHVGYAYLNGTGGSKGVSSFSIVASFNSGTNVGTLSWSGTTLQYTASRMTNYDGYSIVVEWGANRDNNAHPTYANFYQ
jgi:hypothetical protein